MQTENLKLLLEQVRSNELDMDSALAKLRSLLYWLLDTSGSQSEISAYHQKL